MRIDNTKAKESGLKAHMVPLADGNDGQALILSTGKMVAFRRVASGVTSHVWDWVIKSFRK